MALGGSGGDFTLMVVLIGLMAALALEMGKGRFPEALPGGIAGICLVAAAAAGGPPGAVRAFAAFAAGTTLAFAPVVSGRLAPRHALAFGMVACALGIEGLGIMIACAVLAWGAWLFIGRMEREICRKRIVKALYGSSRFVLAGCDADELLEEPGKKRPRGAFAALCLGAAVSMLWHATGYASFIQP